MYACSHGTDFYWALSWLIFSKTLHTTSLLVVGVYFLWLCLRDKEGEGALMTTQVFYLA